MKVELSTYLDVTGGFILGILLLAISFMYVTEKANEHLTTRDAAQIVFVKAKWSWAISAIILMIALYLLPELFKNLMTADKLLSAPPSWIKTGANWVRLSSITLGVASQTLGLLFVSQVLQRAAKLNLSRGLEKEKGGPQ